MGFFKKFNHGRRAKSSAVVFVDYEYMQISFWKRFGINPPVSDWYHELQKTYDIADIYFFADFSNNSIKHNLPEIRKITANTIDTQNTASRYKKDFTDFFILDQIYQKAFDRHSPETFVIFTGDGHFGAVCRFLIGRCNKSVVVYGIEATISSQLKSCATSCIAYPSADRIGRIYYQTFARYMREMLDGTYQYLTFLVVLKYVYEQTQINQTMLHDSLEQMIADGYVTVKEKMNKNRRIRILEPEWDKMKQDQIL